MGKVIDFVAGALRAAAVLAFVLGVLYVAVRVLG
jgi:hypothetical protein